MSETRFKGSLHRLMDVSAIEALASRIVDEILNDQIDGYHCRNPLLADAVAHLLASAGVAHHRTHDTAFGRYYIWIER